MNPPKYEILEKIGEGKFGNVYKGVSTKTGEFIAIKVGSSPMTTQLLKNEATILNYLYSNGCRKISTILWYGRMDTIDSLCFVMPLFTCSLDEYIRLKGRVFTKDIIRSIMIQAILILESVHRNFVIHRDIKPQNFMIQDGELYLIDFGFATFYVNAEKQHISMNSAQESILGTPKYISLYNHMGLSSSRRDDMISLGYVIFYLCYPREPSASTLVDKLSLQNKEYDRTHILHPMNQQLKMEKRLESIEAVCKADHPEIYYYLKACYDIEYHQCPDYNVLQKNINTTLSIMYTCNT
jgi:serine/threonine protein kinase